MNQINNKKIDKVFLKVRSRIDIEPQELILGQDIEFVIKGNIVKTETEDNQDGSVNIVYVVKPLVPAEINKQGILDEFNKKKT